MTLLAVLTTAVLLTAASLVVGHALRRACGYAEFSWTAAPIGLAGLIVLASAGVALPGHAVTAVVLIVLALVASLAFARGIPVLEAAVVGGLALAAACLPWAAAGRIGILGVTDNADLIGHLVLADAVGHGNDPVGLDPSWWPAYPTGPHALAAAVARGMGIGLDAVFEGLLLAAVAVAALGALAVLGRLTPGRRAIGAVLAALPYLVAAYVIQSSFKEPIQVALLMGWALALGEAAAAFGSRRTAFVPPALLAAGCFATFSMVGLVWPAAVALAWAGLHLLADRRLPRVDRRIALTTAGVFAVALAVAATPQLSRAQKFFGGAKAAASGATTGGNIRADVPAYEVSGVWPVGDFRTLGPHATQARLLGIAGLVLAAWAAWWCWRRRRFEVLALACGGIAVYVPARLLATPYYGAKALAIAASGVMLMTLAAALEGAPPLRELRAGLYRRAAVAVVAVAFVALAGWSSALALRGARVAPRDHERELASLRPVVAGQPTLYMGENDYIAWYLRGAKLAFPYSYLGQSQIDIQTRPEKPWTITRPFDFDSIDARVLDQLRYAVATRAAYASAPPENWRVAKTTRSFVLYERTGPSPPRAILPEGAGPGASLDCESSKPAGSEAAVMADPTAARPKDYRWNDHDPQPVSRGQYGFASVETGVTVWARLDLPAGRHRLSLQYLSPTPVEITAGATRLRVPASLEGPGVMWPLGTIASDGAPLWVRLRAKTPGALAKFRTVLFGVLAATREADPPREVVPMARACGRYVDFYRPA